MPSLLLRRLPARSLPLLRPAARTFTTTPRHLAASNNNEANSAAAKEQKDGPKPKILASSPPKDEDAPEDVRQHNREMAQRADRPQEKVQSREEIEKDKVPKEFWKGSGAAGD